MQSKYTNITIFMSLNDFVRPNVYDCCWTLFIFSVLQLSTNHYLQDSKKNERTARSYFRKGPGYKVLVAYTTWYMSVVFVCISNPLVPVADPDRCHGLQETYEKCQPKFNTIYKFCSYQKQRTR